MDLWYEWLLSHLKENINRLDKKLMRMICKIGKLRHPSFIKNLDFNALKRKSISLIVILLGHSN